MSVGVRDPVLLCRLPNISKSKGSQTIKYAQLIEYKMRNIFFVKSYTKDCRDPDPFTKNPNSAYLKINSRKCYKVCFYCMTKSKSSYSVNRLLSFSQSLKSLFTVPILPLMRKVLHISTCSGV